MKVKLNNKHYVNSYWATNNTYRTKLVLENICQILNLAEEFVNIGRTYSDRHINCYINTQGNLVSEVNVACSCHPQMETKEVCLESFYKWLDEKIQKEKKAIQARREKYGYGKSN